MDKTTIAAAIAEAIAKVTEQPAKTEPAADAEVILSNITVLKATDGGERWLEAYCGDLNCNVRLNQDAVNALEASDFIKTGTPEKVTDKMQKMRLRGGVVRAVIGAVRNREIEPGKTKREATMKKFVAVEKTGVEVPSKFAF